MTGIASVDDDKSPRWEKWSPEGPSRADIDCAAEYQRLTEGAQEALNAQQPEATPVTQRLLREAGHAALLPHDVATTVGKFILSDFDLKLLSETAGELVGV